MRIGLSFTLSLAALSLSAQATLNKSTLMSEQIVSIPVGGERADEICAIPPHFADGKYSEKDLEHEKELCALDKNSTAAVCGKRESTNPGLNFYQVKEGQSAQALAQAGCAGAKKIAKYKLSTSCSYAPSIVGYYHLSRILGDAGHVPPAVIRTFDLPDHIRIGRKTVSSATGLIRQTWGSLLTQLQAGAQAPKRDRLLTSDFQQSYGALQKNPRGEKKYTDFFNGGAKNTIRAANFKANNAIVKLLNKRVPVADIVGRNFNADTVQKLVQMKDASDMIVLDTLMNQEDRFGNVHYKERYFYLDENNKLKSDDKLSDEEVARLKAVKAKQIILKDNDCGGSSRTNIAKGAGLSSVIGHMDPKTYERLLKLNQAIGDEAVQKFFTAGLLFTREDLSSLRANLQALVGQLHEACVAGKLRLDLDVKDYFKGSSSEQSCDI